MRTPSRPKPPPNPWYCAVAAAPFAALGIAPGTRIVLRESRSGGWRVLSKTKHLVIGAKGIGRFVHFLHWPGEALFRADQEKAEAHFRALLKAEAFEGMPGVAA